MRKRFSNVSGAIHDLRRVLDLSPTHSDATRSFSCPEERGAPNLAKVAKAEKLPELLAPASEAVAARHAAPRVRHVDEGGWVCQTEADGN